MNFSKIFIKSKKNIIFVFVLFILQLVYFILNNDIVDFLNSYFIITDFIYIKGVGLIFILLNISELIKFYDRECVKFRYAKIEDMIREMSINFIKIGIYSIIVINFGGIILSLNKEINNNTIILSFIYIARQIFIFMFISITYFIIYGMIKKTTFVYMVVFSYIYIPHIILTSLRKNLLTPFDMLSMLSISKEQLISQINISIVLVLILIYLYKYTNVGNRIKRNFISQGI